MDGLRSQVRGRSHSRRLRAAAALGAAVFAAVGLHAATTSATSGSAATALVASLSAAQLEAAGWRFETGQVAIDAAPGDTPEPIGDRSAYAAALRASYLARARAAADADDFDAADYFVDRAEIVADGVVPPYPTAPDQELAARSARRSLAALAAAGARDEAGDAMAEAEVAFDCWVGAGVAPDVAAACQAEAEASIEALAERFLPAEGATRRRSTEGFEIVIRPPSPGEDVAAAAPERADPPAETTPAPERAASDRPGPTAGSEPGDALGVVAAPEPDAPARDPFDPFDGDRFAEAEPPRGARAPARPAFAQSDAARSGGDRASARGPARHVVYFAFDSDALSPAARRALRAAAESARRRGGRLEVILEGHADRAGPAAYNLDLSDRRAQRVAAFLADMLPRGARIERFALGETAPARPTRDGVRERLNRRVEIEIE